MKNILVMLFLLITVVVFVPVQKADATFHIPDFNICNIAPQLCQVTPSVTPSIVVDPTVAPSIEPTSEVTVEPTVDPTATPTAAPSGGDGKGDGLSDGKHQAPDGLGCAVHECKAVVPKAPPATGRG